MVMMMKYASCNLARVAVGCGCRVSNQASARGHRQVGLLKPFIATPETFLKQPGPVSWPWTWPRTSVQLILAVLDVVGSPCATRASP